MIIRPASIGLSTSVDPTASALRAALRPATFVPARRDDDIAEVPARQPQSVGAVALPLRDAA